MGSRRSRVASVIGCLGVLSALLVPLAGPASAQECAQPYPPVFAQTTYPGLSPAPQLDAASVTIPTLDGDVPGGVVSAGHPKVPDFDGDGQSDWYPFSIPGEPTITRPSGALKLARAGDNLAVTVAGNLDGLPGQEIWAYDTPSIEERNRGLPHTGDLRAWVVPYGTPEGGYDPADVGIEVPRGTARPIPDWTGDGIDDVLLVRGTPDRATTDLLSGSDILAAGVPGDSRRVKQVVTIPGVGQILADFGGSKPAIVTSDKGERFGEGFVVRLYDGDTTTEFTDLPYTFSGVSGPVAGFTALRGRDGRFLRLDNGSRSGSFSWWWSLDHPCSPLSPASEGSPAPAVPASPTVGRPRLTG